MTNTKKRKGPSESATKFPVGTKKKGNDGNIWIIIKTKTGNHRWKKLNNNISKKNTNANTNAIKLYGKQYFTHDNGGRPFMVNINKNNVEIYKYSNNLDIDHEITKNDYNILVKTYKNVNKIFIGNSIKGDDANGNKKFGLGNSILLKIGNNNYVFIGDYVYEFQSLDNIIDFFSMIGNSDVPYPVAIGEKNVYYLIDKGSNGYLSKEYFEDFPNKHSWGLDSYAKLWGQKPFTDNIPKNANFTQAENIRKKSSFTSLTKKIPKIKIINKRPGFK